MHAYACTLVTLLLFFLGGGGFAFHFKKGLPSGASWVLRRFSLCRNSLNRKRNAHKAELEVKQREEKSNDLQQLLQDFEEQMEREILEVDDHEPANSTEAEECMPERATPPETHRALMAISEEDTKDDGTPVWLEAEPKLFLCDDWIMLVEV